MELDQKERQKKRDKERKAEREKARKERRKKRREREPMKKDKDKAKAVGGEMVGIAFIYWSDTDNRYELKIDNKLKGYSSGAKDPDHSTGRETLKKIAEDKGYTVLLMDG